MGYLRGFIPWIVYAVVASFDWRWGALAGLVSGVVLFLQDRRAGVPGDAQILDVSTIVYFVGVGALAFAAPHSPLRPYADVLSFGWLALTAWGTLAVGRPFTLGIARQQTPREYWELPEFIQVNAVITAAWALSFTVLGGALAICAATAAPTWVGIVCHVAGLAAPVVFTSWYPARMQARAEGRPVAPTA